MDVLLLSRLQFAVATYFHFLFVPLTLGLSILIAIMETAYVRTKNVEYQAMAKFWGKLFLINFAVGVVTGITLEFQFGTNWSRYSRYVGDILGPSWLLRQQSLSSSNQHLLQSGHSAGKGSPRKHMPYAYGLSLLPPAFPLSGY